MPSKEQSMQEINVAYVYEVEKEDWHQPLIDYLNHRKLPNDVRHKMKIQRRASCFLYYNGTLYGSSFLCFWLRYSGKKEAQ